MAQLVGWEDVCLECIQDRCGLFGLLRIEPGEDGPQDALFLLVEAGKDAFLSGLQIADACRNLGQDRPASRVAGQCLPAVGPDRHVPAPVQRFVGQVDQTSLAQSLSPFRQEALQLRSQGDKVDYKPVAYACCVQRY